MSLAGRPSMRGALDEIVARSAGDLYYVCRRLDQLDGERPRAKVLECSDCGCDVVATPYILAEKRALAATHGKKVVVVCDDCIPLNPGRAIVAVMPTREEAAEAERFNRG